MFNCTSANNHHVFTVVVVCMKVDNHISIDGVDIINVSKNRLTHHVFAINVIVDVFHKGLLGVLVYGLELLPYCVFFHFEMVQVID